MSASRRFTGQQAIRYVAQFIREAVRRPGIRVQRRATEVEHIIPIHTTFLVIDVNCDCPGRLTDL
jgi:hypothetical protein